MRKLQTKSRALWRAILQEFEQQNPPVTVRQMFYLCSVAGHVSKDEAGYRKVAYALLAMRRAGAIPYGWIADNTRWMRKGESFGDLSAALNSMHKYYRRDLWASQRDRVEIWLEKDALSSSVFEVTDEYDVPLYVTRGYSSETFLFSAAEAMQAENKPTYIYHFGDYDPSGKDAARHIAETLARFGAEFTFTEAAVTAEQVHSLRLPTRPTKRQDTRARAWQGGSVELDAIPPAELRRMVRTCIEQHIDAKALAFSRELEAQERATIEDLSILGLVQKTDITVLDLGIVQRLQKQAPAQYQALLHGRINLDQAKFYLVQEGLL